MQNNKEEKVKQVYEQPKLRIINLSAEEVLAVGCKTAPGDLSGVANAGCTMPMCSVTTGS